MMNSNFLSEEGRTFSAECGTISESGLFSKIKGSLVKAGRKLIENVLILWYALPEASVSDAAVIIGALLYFISPVDVIPDFLPGGFADDLTVVLAAVTKIRKNASKEVLERARRTVEEWFD